MTKRTVCPKCLRAKTACICHCVRVVNHQTSIAILQHPSERLQSKGTARLAALSLKNTTLWIGETVEEATLELKKTESNGHLLEDSQKKASVSLANWIAQKPTLLLYPPIEQTESLQMIPAGDILQHYPLDGFQVLILDGTWRKTHKMMMLNSQLQTLPRITIDVNSVSNYRIRQQKNAYSLSTIEAISQLLQVLEPNNAAIETLQSSFAKMQDFILSLRTP